MEAKISMIVPVYKVEKELDRCVKRILQQTYENLEIILVDDGSPDGCPEMCDAYAKSDSRIKVIHKENGGISDARNAGLRAASGEYVMYVDSDDYIETDACERLLASMQDDVDLVVGVCREVTGEEVTYRRHSNLISGKRYSAREYVILSIQKNEWFIPVWLNLYRREFLLKHQLFFRVGYCYEDFEILPRLFLAAKTIVYLDYPFYNYIIRENSIMTSKVTDQKRKMLIDISATWLKEISDVQDPEYQKYLFGMLIRYYVSNARRMKICGWKVEGLNFSFAWKYALSFRERLKVLLFHCLPELYIRL